MEKKKTLGFQVLETHEEHMQSDPIEAYELAHEGGKSYMNALIDVVEDHRNKIDKYYIQVISTKPLEYRNRAVYFRFFARQTAPLMEDDCDCWFVDNKKDILRLEWSLPHWSDFDLFLEDPEQFDPKIIKWIKIYKKSQKK